MSEKNNSLEIYIAESLKVLDPTAKPTKASGARGQQGDVANKFFIIECKKKLTKENIIIDYKKEWLKTCKKLSITEARPVLIVTENKHRKKFVTLLYDDFLNIISSGEMIHES